MLRANAALPQENPCDENYGITAEEQEEADDGV